MAERTAKLVFVGTSMVRQERNEWGDKVRTRYRTGDEVEVASADVDKLLTAEVGGRPVWVKNVKDAEKAEGELPRDDVDPTVGTDVARKDVVTSSTVNKK